MTDSQSNPYEAPSNSLEGDAVPQRRTRWRIISVALTAFFGGLMLLSSPTFLRVALDISVKSGGGIVSTPMLGAILLTFGAIGYLYSARCGWGGRWVRSGVVLAAAICIQVLGSYLMKNPSW